MTGPNPVDVLRAHLLSEPATDLCPCPHDCPGLALCQPRATCDADDLRGPAGLERIGLSPLASEPVAYLPSAAVMSPYEGASPVIYEPYGGGAR